jgi:hemerythrin
MATEWGAEIELDHPQLDAQHDQLFQCLRAAAGALEGRSAAVAERVSAFADALMEHLAAEEALMDETRYPDRGRHKAAHELFVADFLQMREELREKGPTPLVEEWIRTRLPEWLRFHIRVNDAPLAAHLRRRLEPGEARPRKGDGRHLS